MSVHIYKDVHIDLHRRKVIYGYTYGFSSYPYCSSAARAATISASITHPQLCPLVDGRHALTAGRPALHRCFAMGGAAIDRISGGHGLGKHVLRDPSGGADADGRSCCGWTLTSATDDHHRDGSSLAGGRDRRFDMAGTSGDLA